MFHLLDARDADGRLGELERFLEFWYGPRQPEYGEPEECLARVRLPSALRRFYAFAGRWPSPEPDRLPRFFAGAGGHHLLPFDGVEPAPDGRVRFFTEYQGDWDGLTLADGDDPPVWLSGDFGDDEPGERTVQVEEAISRFLVTHGLMTTLYEGENSPCAVPLRRGRLVDFFLDPPAPVRVERIWVAEGKDWPEGCGRYAGEFSLLQDHVLVHRDGDAYHFGALHPAGIRLMVSLLSSGA